MTAEDDLPPWNNPCRPWRFNHILPTDSSFQRVKARIAQLIAADPHSPGLVRPRRYYEDEPTEKPIIVNIETSGPSWKEINAIEQRLLNSLTEQRKLREQIEGLTKALGRLSVAGRQTNVTRPDSKLPAL